MSNITKDQSTTRNNNSGPTEFEQSASNKKKQLGSDIFGGYTEDNTHSGPTKPNRNAGNNNIGTVQEQTSNSTNVAETHAKAVNIAEQYKQTQLKSNIFGPDEPATTRHVSDKNKSNIFGTDEPATTRHVADKNKSNIFGTDEPASTRNFADKNKSNIFAPEEPTSARHFSDKNKSNIFGIGDNNENKRQTGGRQGVRVGYNPISGESYTTKDNVNSKTNEKQPDLTVKAPGEENANAQTVPANATAENGNSHTEVEKPANGNSETVVEKPANGNSQTAVEKPAAGQDNATNGNNGQKNVHTSVRVFHPPGGKSNGPLW